MKSKLLTLFIVYLIGNTLVAQDLGLEYFAKVPTKFGHKDVSPLKFFQVSYMNMPGNKFLHNTVYISSDLFKVKLQARTSVSLNVGFDYSTNKEWKEWYEVSGVKAKETINFNSYMPLASVAINYGFYYPYFVRVGLGAYSNYERAKYTAFIPQQYSGSNSIETAELNYVFLEKINSGIKPYTYIEIYSPFKDKPNGQHRFGMTGGLYLWPSNEKGMRRSINIGVYWNAN